MPVVKHPQYVVSKLRVLRARLEQHEQEVRRIWREHVAAQSEKKRQK